MSFVLFKFISLALLYDFSRLKYQVIDFDGDLKWYHPERTVLSQSVKLEASLLIPWSSPVYIQIGYGHTFDFVQLDAGDPVRSGRHYFICALNKKN
jgi:hypothetical protein